MSIGEIDNLYNILTEQGVVMNVNGSSITIFYDGVESTVQIENKGTLRVMFEIMNSDTIKHFMEVE